MTQGAGLSARGIAGEDDLAEMEDVVAGVQE